MNALLDRPYHPSLPLRSGQLQTFLASSPWRAWGPNAMQAAARAEIVATNAGVRLLGFRSSQPAAHPMGLVILLHGWEGSADSTYMRCTGRALYQRGYDVFRLNLRDHGPSHHLNPGIFFAVLIEEACDAVSQLCLAAHPMPAFLVGFSLGANFALRIALGCRHRPLLNLRHVVAVSPVLAPRESTPGAQLLKQAIARLNLSARAYHRVLKVARTLADLAGAGPVASAHIAEAIHYRRIAGTDF